jgi:putative transposase
MGFPTWKKKGRARDSCRFTTGQIKVLADRKHVQLPRLGVLARTANLRREALHQLTAQLATGFGIVVVEQLHMAGMLRNRALARALTDSGMAQLRRLLAYKTSWYGSRLIVADPFHPSSKTCSACGWVKAKLTLGERTFKCGACDLVLDRVLNAVRNLANLTQHVAQSGWETRNARGVDVRPDLVGRTAMKREAGTGHRPGKAGTVDP